MSKPEWGEKRECPECGTRFYDLRRDPVICPKCRTPYAVTAEGTPAPVPRESAEDGARAAPAESADGAGSGTEDNAGELSDIDIEDDADDEDEDIIEDADELVKEDDMADVLDGAIDESKTAE